MDFLKNAKRLPVLDWNLTFFGAHEQRVGADWVVPVEKHYAFECIFVLNGFEYVKIQNHTYTLSQGDFFLIPPEFSHQVWAGKSLRYFCFHFDLDDPNLKIQLIKGVSYQHEKASPLCKQITPHLLKLDSLIEDASFNFDTKMIIQIELSKMLRIFYKQATVHHSTSSSTSVEYSRVMADYMKSQLTNQVLTFIKHGYELDTRPVTVDEAIKQVGVSNGYGFRIFKETYGISPREYLTKLKIDEAKKLLMKPNYSVYSVGSALGYSSLANFSRQFKRWTGVSPNQFKKTVD